MTLLRVLVVDDSLANRSRLIAGIEGSGKANVVGAAKDGAEALRLVGQVAPDVITLDLEMPNMDGFSFLRLLMSTRPTPVIVVSSYSQKENVFRALELGALDFVAKPSGDFATHGDEVIALLLQKLLLVRSVRQSRVSGIPSRRQKTPEEVLGGLVAPKHLVAIAASTGGPTALTEILSRLSSKAPYAVLIAQHMPPKFTTTFAQRLDRYSTLRVVEARDGDVISSGMAFVCPGNRCMEVARGGDGKLRVRLVLPALEERYVPNATRLLTSVGKLFGDASIGVVLTGMGDDGAEGARVIADHGGRLLVESEESAVVYGMPRAAARAVPSAQQVELSQMHQEITRLVGGSDSAQPRK
ncbi:MAG: hypothetical protein RJA70_852 [Pseudomonadota bacterium]|jgi:two-component system chemotaxis response regulator CheB